MKRILCIVVCLLFSIVMHSQVKKVVIGNALGNASSELKEMFRDAMESAITDSWEFEVISNRDEYKQQIQSELEFQEGGLMNEDDWISLGKAKGADLIIFPKINSFDDQYTITIKLIELESGVSSKTIKPIYCPRATIVSEGVERLVEALSGAGTMSSAPSSKVVDCEAIPGLVIDYYNRDEATWDSAVDDCKNLGPGWRLPNRREVVQIISYMIKHSRQYGSNWIRTTYWTSDERNNFSSFSVEYPSSSITYESKTAKCVYRCIKTSER